MVCNTILCFLVFQASFFYCNAVILYLTNGYVGKSRRATLASFASLATLALPIFFKNLRFHSFGCGSTAPRVCLPVDKWKVVTIFLEAGKMKKAFLLLVAVCVCIAGSAFADTFAQGTANEFSIDFVSISGGTNPSSGYGIVNNDYRMGTLEISNDQWTKFQSAYGPVTGSPSNAYDESPYFTGMNVPTNNLSWYEGAQFVNYLNTSNGHQAAYKFTGTQGTGDYTLGIWDTANAAGGTNLYRHKDAHYFLPTEDEWVKAAYWNGSTLQTWATVGDVAPTQSGWNFYDDGYATDPYGPWDVGSGSAELNGTYDMMGNVWEWMESPYHSGDFLSGSDRGLRGGSFGHDDYYLRSSYRYSCHPYDEFVTVGFRVASVPEPASLVLLLLGGLTVARRRK